MPEIRIDPLTGQRVIIATDRAARPGITASLPDADAGPIDPVTDPFAPGHESETFCGEQGVPRREELDGRDDEAIHLVAVEHGTVLGGCRLLFIGPTVQFSRLAVRQSARRRGLAGLLLALADEETRVAGARRLVLHAQTYARSLYDAAGYEVRGRVFMEAGIEHVAMEKTV